MESIREIFRIGYGPSSSHTMAPRKAAEQFLKTFPESTSFRVVLYGSLAATGKGHMTDSAIVDALSPYPVDIVWKPNELLPLHPNGMRFEAFNDHGEIFAFWNGYSVGGGAVKGENEWNSPRDSVYSLTTMDDILEWNKKTGGNLWELVFDSEGTDIIDFLNDVWQVMKQSILSGLDNEGLLPGDLSLQRKAAATFMKAENSKAVLGHIGKISAYALAVSEENAAGGKVVTAPTCGSAGVLPSVLFYMQKNYNLSDQKIIRALATAGLIGALVKENASISGAEVGCQGEIGAACAMAAGAATQLFGGSVSQIEYAAEMGIEHHLGLTCDPVGGYVQIPCIERNAIGAGRALQCASYCLLTDGSHTISFDEVVQTMKETGLDMGICYKETSRCGLAKNWRLSETKKNSGYQ